MPGRARRSSGRGRSPGHGSAPIPLPTAGSARSHSPRPRSRSTASPRSRCSWTQGRVSPPLGCPSLVSDTLRDPRGSPRSRDLPEQGELLPGAPQAEGPGVIGCHQVPSPVLWGETAQGHRAVSPAPGWQSWHCPGCGAAPRAPGQAGTAPEALTDPGRSGAWSARGRLRWNTSVFAHAATPRVDFEEESGHPSLCEDSQLLPALGISQRSPGNPRQSWSKVQGGV